MSKYKKITKAAIRELFLRPHPFGIVESSYYIRSVARLRPLSLGQNGLILLLAIIPTFFETLLQCEYEFSRKVYGV